jgi:hypothetical protein
MITRVPNQYLLVVSHDCDIRCEEEKEPFIEIIPCEKIENLEGNFSKGQNPRCFDFKVTIPGNPSPSFFRLYARKKDRLFKRDLGFYGKEIIKIDPWITLALQDWLAMRYRRQALPDAFNASFGELIKNRTIRRKLAKLYEALHGIWAVIDPLDEELLAAEGIPYDVMLYFIFNSQMSGAEERVFDFVTAFDKEYEAKQKNPGFLISLETKVLSDSEFTYYLQRKSIFLNYDYLSNSEP